MEEMQNDYEDFTIRSPNEDVTISFSKRINSSGHIDITSKSIGYGHSSMIRHFVQGHDLDRLIEFLQKGRDK
jgi:hypothetical protein